MSEKIDINTANAETLMSISGIGPALAERIITYRETVHPFEEVIELAAVPGVSEKMVRGFADWVTVESTAVSHDIDDLEETPLLVAPEPMELLDAPEQPEALLAAKLPKVEAVIMDEITPDEDEVAPDVEEDTFDEVSAEISAVEETVVEEPVEPEPVAEIEEVPESDPVFSQPVPLPTAVSEPPPAAPAEFTEPPTAVPSQPPINWEAKARRRGCLSTLLGATFGAILGAVLTLAVLAALNNGSINYAYNDSVIRQQLDSEIISRTNELNQLSTRVSIVTTTEAEANQSLQADLEAASEGIADNEEIISYLATRSGDLELRLQDVAGAADTFNSFLDGLSLLLDDLDESPSTPLPAPAGETITATPSPTPFSTSTPLPRSTTAVQPTRTPQPSATPFTFPTNTPASQP
jgi:competence ComEA-like helix-hairpin-helix protein